MAFEDDMIEAGFNDPEDYMEYLMDEGDRLLQKQLERENDYSFRHESPYDGMSESQINRIELRHQQGKIKNYAQISQNKKRLIIFKKWSENNEEFIKWNKNKEEERLSRYWDTVKALGWSWKFDDDIMDSEDFEDEDEGIESSFFPYSFSAWKQYYQNHAPELLYNMCEYWLERYTRCTIIDGNYIYNEKWFDTMTSLLSNYRSPEELILRKKLKNEFGQEYIFPILSEEKRLNDLLCSIGEYLQILCFKNTCLQERSFYTFNNKNNVVKHNIREIKRITDYNFLKDGWFSINQGEMIYFRTLFSLKQIQSNKLFINQLSWLDEYYFLVKSWMKRMDNHPEELKYVIFDYYSNYNEDLANLKKLISSFNISWARNQCKKIGDSISHYIPLKDFLTLLEWNVDHPHKRF